MWGRVFVYRAGKGLQAGPPHEAGSLMGLGPSWGWVPHGVGSHQGARFPHRGGRSPPFPHVEGWQGLERTRAAAGAWLSSRRCGHVPHQLGSSQQRQGAHRALWGTAQALCPWHHLGLQPGVSSPSGGRDQLDLPAPGPRSQGRERTAGPWCCPRC